MKKFIRLLIALAISIFCFAFFAGICWLFEHAPKVLFVLFFIGLFIFLTIEIYKGIEIIDESEKLTEYEE